MAQPNFTNRTLWTGDNLDILRGMNSECVDLIYLDPPFNSNQDYSAPVGSAAAGAAFKDTWTLSDVDDAWHGMIAESHPALYGIIDAARPAHGKGMKSYLIMMAVRLLEMHRVLKPTGSIYLHCDDTASHYLKLLMDSVFGANQFRNHIIWRRATAHNDPKRFGRNIDHILYYAKSDQWTWNGSDIATPKSDDEIKKSYPQTDERGPVRSENLTGPLHGTSPGMPSTTPWKGYDVYARGRCWSPPKTGAYAEYIERHFIPGYRNIEGVQERLDALDAAGLIHHPTTGVWPGLKRYADSDRGNPPQSLVLEPTGFTNYNKGKEWVGYPTQKPLALLERIIKASSNPGDLVLDPFCGCATGLVAAEKLDREWAGIDLSPKAKDLVELRLRNDLGLFGLQTTYREDVPQRTDLGQVPPYRTQKHTLFGKQEGQCAGCGIMFPFRNFTIDHIVPQSRGGTDHLENLQLLCGACNSLKGDRPQEYLLARLKEMGV